MSQIVKITDRPQEREIRPKNGRAPFIAHEQVGYVIDQDTGRQQDVVFRVEDAIGYKPGTYRPRPPKLVRGDFDSAMWERRVDLELVAEHGDKKAAAASA